MGFYMYVSVNLFENINGFRVFLWRQTSVWIYEQIVGVGRLIYMPHCLLYCGKISGKINTKFNQIPFLKSNFYGRIQNLSVIISVTRKTQH